MVCRKSNPLPHPDEYVYPVPLDVRVTLEPDLAGESQRAKHGGETGVDLVNKVVDPVKCHCWVKTIQIDPLSSTSLLEYVRLVPLGNVLLLGHRDLHLVRLLPQAGNSADQAGV